MSADDVFYLKCPVCKAIRRGTNLKHCTDSSVYFYEQSYDHYIPVTLTREGEVALTLAGRVFSDPCPKCVARRSLKAMRGIP